MADLEDVPVLARLDAYQQSHPVVGFPLAVIDKYLDDQGAYLAALVTYYGFVSLFPLLFVLSTVLGLVLAGDPHAQAQVLHSTLRQFPVIGPQLGDPKHLGGGAPGVAFGTVAALYGGLGVAQALQNAMNTAWAVPRVRRPNPLAARGRSLVLLATIGVALIGTSVLSALGSWAGVLGSLVLNVGVFTLAFRVSTDRELSARDVLPGALVATVAWQLLQAFGATYVDHIVRHASDVNSVFALVLGLLGFIYVASVMVLLCVEINVVRVDHLHPRALFAELRKDAELTAADRRALTEEAQAQRRKGSEEIDVRFTDP